MRHEYRSVGLLKFREMKAGESESFPEISTKAGKHFIDSYFKTTNVGALETYGQYLHMQSGGTGTGYVYTHGAMAKSVTGGYVAELGACYFKTQLTAGTVTGQSYVGFFEFIVDTGVANMPSGGVLQLVSIVNGSLNDISGYIVCRDYGTAPMKNLFYILDHTSGSGKLFYGSTLRLNIAGTSYFIPLSSAENTLTYSGVVSISNTTDASSLTAGALVVAGGIACAKQLYLGDDIDMSVSGTGVYDITLKTNVADALSITDGTDIMVFKTSATRMLTITPAVTITGPIINDDTTDTSSGTTGAIQTDGGIGIAKALYVGTTTTSAGAMSVGANAAGADATFYSAVTAYKVWWDANGDTNGAWYFGADTKGVQVNLYGDVTGCGVFWDPSTDTNGTLSIGATGGSKGNDVIAYGATNGNYLHWDQSEDDLLLVGTSTQLAVAGTTASTSTTTGSLRTAGGLGVAGAAWIGGGISSSGQTLTPDASRTYIAYQIGSRGTEKDITMAASTDQNLDPMQINLNIIGAAPTNTSTLNGIYQQITHDTTDMPNLRLKGCDWTITTDKQCMDAYVIQTELIVSGTKTSGGELMAMSALTTLGAGARTADRVLAFQAMITGDGTAGTVVGDCFVAYFVNAGTVITTDSIINVRNQSAATSVSAVELELDGTVTYAFDFQGTVADAWATGDAAVTQADEYVKIPVRVAGVTPTLYILAAETWS